LIKTIDLDKIDSFSYQRCQSLPDFAENKKKRKEQAEKRPKKGRKQKKQKKQKKF